MILDQFKLTNRSALVIGGNRGLGIEMAKALAEAGASVAVAARDVDRNDEAVSILKPIGEGRAMSVTCDVATRYEPPADSAPEMEEEPVAQAPRVEEWSDPPTEGGGEEGDPDECPDWSTFEGCCEGETLYYCEDETFLFGTCPVGYACGWDPANNYYSCVDEESAGAEPSGVYPWQCDSDAVEEGPIVAYEMDGKLMSRRDKGPLWLIYPYSSNAEYRTEVIYSRSIWQLDRMAIR